MNGVNSFKSAQLQGEMARIQPIRHLKNGGEDDEGEHVDRQNLEGSVEEMSSIIQIGLKSLKKFESKGKKKAKTPAKGTVHSHVLNAWAAQLTDPSQASILLEMVKADKFGLLTNDINQLKKDL